MAFLQYLLIDANQYLQYLIIKLVLQKIHVSLVYPKFHGVWVYLIVLNRDFVFMIDKILNCMGIF